MYKINDMKTKKVCETVIPGLYLSQVTSYPG